MRTFAGHHGDVECVEFHGNASYLASADKTIRLWDLGSGKTVRLMLGHWVSGWGILPEVFVLPKPLNLSRHNRTALICSLRENYSKKELVWA